MTAIGARRREVAPHGGIYVLDRCVAKRRRALTAGLLLGTCLSPVCLWSGPAWAIDVANETQLRSAIFAINGGSADTTINITASTITLTQSLPMITASVTVTGNGNTIDAQ